MPSLNLIQMPQAKDKSGVQNLMRERSKNNPSEHFWEIKHSWLIQRGFVLKSQNICRLLYNFFIELSKTKFEFWKKSRLWNLEDIKRGLNAFKGDYIFFKHIKFVLHISQGHNQ